MMGASGTRSADVILDTIGDYNNAGQLVKALTQVTVGNISLDQTLGAHNMEHLLIAYEVSGGTGVNIADVTIINTTGTAIGGFVDTANPKVSVSAVDLIDIVGQNVAQFDAHNFHFV